MKFSFITLELYTVDILASIDFILKIGFGFIYITGEFEVRPKDSDNSITLSNKSIEEIS